MTIKYKNTFRDTAVFYFHHISRSWLFVGSYGLFFALMSFANYRALPSDGDTTAKVITFVLMEVFALLLLGGVFLLTSVCALLSAKSKAMLTEHSITLEESGFTEETIYNKTEHKWAIVQKLPRTKRYLYIYIAPHMAHVVPRRAFPDETEWNAFYEYCKRRSGV